MDTLTLISGLVLGGGVLALILYPLWQQTRPEAIFRVDRSGQTLEEYQARYQATLAAIRDLMFDYEMGKVSAGDYETLLHKTKLEAAKIRQQIDRLSRSAEEAAVDPAVEAQIETLLNQLKASKLNGYEALLPEIDAEIESLKSIKVEADVDGPACPNCGQLFEPGDAFCSGCGQSLAGVELGTAENICPQCGYAFQADDVFCAKCGTALEKTAQTQKRKDAQITERSL